MAKSELFEIDVWWPEAWLFILNTEQEDQKTKPKVYQSKDIQRIAGVSKIQLLNWTQRGAIIPLKDASGRGSVRVYSYQNLMEAIFCRNLNAFRLDVSEMKKALDVARETLWPFKFSLNSWKRGREDELRLREKLGPKISSHEKELSEKVLGLIERNEIPTMIERKHRVWDFLRLYPVGLTTLYWVFWSQEVFAPDKNKQGKIFESGITLYDSMNIDAVFNNANAFGCINLDLLVRETENYFHLPKDSSEVRRYSKDSNN